MNVMCGDEVLWPNKHEETIVNHTTGQEARVSTTKAIEISQEGVVEYVTFALVKQRETIREEREKT